MKFVDDDDDDDDDTFTQKMQPRTRGLIDYDVLTGTTISK